MLAAVHSSVPPGDPRHRFREAASCSQATLALLRAGSGPLALWHPTLYPPQHSPRRPVTLGSSPSLVSFPLAPLPSGCLFFFLFFSSTFSSPEVSGRGQSFLRESLTPLGQAAVPPPLPLPTTVGRWAVGETVHPEHGGHDLDSQPRTQATLTSPESHPVLSSPGSLSAGAASPATGGGQPAGPQWCFLSQQTPLLHPPGSRGLVEGEGESTLVSRSQKTQPHLESLSS